MRCDATPPHISTINARNTRRQGARALARRCFLSGDKRDFTLFPRRFHVARFS
jgi:hypothetical protein